MILDIALPRSIGILADINRLRRERASRDRDFLFPWRAPCPLKILLVTDGILDFGVGDFGLSAFVAGLQSDRPFYVTYEITLAHLRADNGPDVQQGAAGISASIRGFRFDDAQHFGPDRFDEVWLFGFETNFKRPEYGTRNSSAAYPAGRLSDAELAALAQHMNSGRGLFATGDHGSLGKGLAGSVLRARNMRHWEPFAGPSGQDEVSMNGARRNDTNRVGNDPGTQFSDQSDDIPQALDLKLYSARIDYFRRARFPHPVFCGRAGRIDVFPDHPHEGECRVPDNTGLTDPFGGAEYPPALSGGGPVLPEIIATAHVPAGNTASSASGTNLKTATEAHSFGAVSAYDGHLAGVGRVICDSTWHHFVNVNLIGVVEGGGFDQFGDTDHVEDASKHDGFLSSPAGQAALGKIVNYFNNIAVWIAPAGKISCFRTRFWWELIYADRIMEAAVFDPETTVERLPVETLRSIGVHARDVIARKAGQCQTIQWVIDWIDRHWVEARLWVDPWDPVTHLLKAEELPLPVFDPLPVIDTALGAAIVAMRQAHPFPPAKMTAKIEKAVIAAGDTGARMGLERAAKHAAEFTNGFTRSLRTLGK